MSRISMFALTLAFVSTAASTQNRQLQFGDHICSYRYTEKTAATTEHSFAEDAKFDEEILEIVYYAGLQPDFIIVEIDQDNAFALIEDQIRYIAYGGNFLRAMERTTNTKWASYSIMAHEMGHHYQGHTIKDGGSAQPSELEADEYSGFILAQMGASVEQAKATMAYLAPETVDSESTHPARAERLRAITKGWDRGQRLIKEQAERYNRNNPKSDPEHAPGSTPEPAADAGVSRLWVVENPSSNDQSKEPETFKFVQSGERLTVAAISPSGEVHLYRGSIQQGIFTVSAETEKVIRRGNTVKIKDTLEGVVMDDGRRIAGTRRYFMDDQLVSNSSWTLRPFQRP